MSEDMPKENESQQSAESQPEQAAQPVAASQPEQPVAEPKAAQPMQEQSQPASQPAQEQPQPASQPMQEQPQPASQPAQECPPQNAPYHEVPQPQQSQAQPQSQPQGESQPQPQPQPQSAPQPQPGQPVQPLQPVQPKYPAYAKTCFGAAWSDITQSEGWFKTILLLGLINIVPVLNFFVQGFAMKWSRQLVVGNFEHMPKKIIESPSFEWGFYAFVITLVTSLCASFAGFIVECIPLFGVVVSLAISLFVYLFQQVMVMRCAMAGRLGAGFEIGKSWDAAKVRFGSLIGAVYFPYLIFGIFYLVVALIIALPMVLSVVDTAMMFERGYYGSSDLAAMRFMMDLFLTMVPMILLLYVISMFTGALFQVWTMRAVAHYIARYAPQWKDDPTLFAYESNYRV